MAHHVLGAEVREAHAVHAVEHVQHMHEAGTGAPGQVDLGDVAGDHGGGAEADAGEEHLHLFDGGVLALVQDDERAVQRAPAHERQRRDFDDVAVDVLVDALNAEHFVQGVVERAQVGVDLLRQIARQEAELLASFHRRTHQQDARHAAAFQRFHRARHRQIRLAGAGRADAEAQVVAADGRHVAALVAAARLDGLLAHGDQIAALCRRRALALGVFGRLGGASAVAGQQFFHAGFLQA